MHLFFDYKKIIKYERYKQVIIKIIFFYIFFRIIFFKLLHFQRKTLILLKCNFKKYCFIYNF